MAHDGKVTISTALDNTGISKDTQKLGSVVKKGAAGLAKAVAKSALAITAAFGTAAVAITKQAVDSYADYQQLMGGVETLFKDSASKVAQYAEDAFYTVGMSANEYMETVTGFSASLISSLGGDTAKAADAANMALTDMADNANKMGTPLENIKNAYQGFAKQNYTMLDNLKLGYGGTKTEMERLLKDAEKLSGVKYDISNLADVYNAIHEIQKRMGITGATAAEAEKTISGSAAMTKAAWKNVLTAIAGGGDIDKAINNLVFSVSKYFENIVPVVEKALSGVGELIEKVAPMLVQSVAIALIKAIPSLLNAVYQMIMGLASGIYEGITALFSGTTKEIDRQLNVAESIKAGYEEAKKGVENFIEANESAKKSLAGFDEIQKIGDSANSTASGGTGAAQDPGVDRKVEDVESQFQSVAVDWNYMLRTLEKELSTALDDITGLILKVDWKGVGDDIEASLKKIDWKGVVVSLAKLLGATVGAAFGMIWGALDEACYAVVDYFADSIAEVEAIGGNIVEGILCGIGKAAANIALWLWENVCKPFLDAFKEAFGIHSPSTVMAEMGDFLIQGFLNGITEAWNKITTFFENAFAGLKDLIKGPVNGIIGFANSMVSGVVGCINSVVDMVNGLSFDVPDWVPGIGGETFGFNLAHVTPPQIPYLAKGAVLPANKPFLAMVGDQKHGTNVEAPLETIQEAVALVMEDMIASNIAGFEAVVAVLREILEAVLGIEIGDDVIGKAVARYNRKMAIVRGGA